MISGIILASGFSTRMTEDKLLLPVEGVPMIERIVQIVMASRVDDLVLVYRCKSVLDQVRHYGIKTVHNPAAVLGQSEAVKIGLKHIAPDSKACFFFMGDQPRISSALIDSMIEDWEKDCVSILVPLYGDKPGSPAMFPRKYYQELSCIQGDRGGKEVIKRHPEVVKYRCIDDKVAGKDVDTYDDYISLITE